MTYKPTTYTATSINTVADYEVPPQLELRDKNLVIGFPLIQRADLVVKVDGVETDDYVFNTDTVIELNYKWNSDDLPSTITLERVTDLDRAIFYPGTPIKAAELNKNYQYLFFKVEELSYAQEQ